MSDLSLFVQPENPVIAVRCQARDALRASHLFPQFRAAVKSLVGRRCLVRYGDDWEMTEVDILNLQYAWLIADHLAAPRPDEATARDYRRVLDEIREAGPLLFSI